jgi:5-methylthioadenosine/S-adenosylhomocysteine deaminase
MLANSGKTIRVIGKVFDDENGERLQTLLISGSKIQSLVEGEAPAPDIPGLITIRLQDNEVLFPGFINLHVHTGYNVFPLWDSPFKQWKNRFQWRKNQQYALDIRGFHDYIQSQWTASGPAMKIAALEHLVASPTNQAFTESFTVETLTSALQDVDKAHAVIGELQAVAGGTVLIQQFLRLDVESATKASFILRNTERPGDLGIGGNLSVVSPVDFFKPKQADGVTDPVYTGNPSQDTSPWVPGRQPDYDQFVASVNAAVPDATNWS